MNPSPTTTASRSPSWDGRTTKPHPVTGREVPDESARVPVVRYRHPRPAAWPATDYIVGNPPFIGPAAMRQALGDGYTEAVRKTHKDVSESSDFVMYWWNHAARLAREGKVQRFGFVTTNSLRQTFNRRVIEKHLTAKPPLSLLFAIPDHPWVDAADGAAVRIAMTTASGGEHTGLLAKVIRESESQGDGYDVELEERSGVIHADLTIGANVSEAKRLQANEGLASEGVKPHGMGFVIQKSDFDRLGVKNDQNLPEVMKPYLNGRDLTAVSRNVYIIELFGLEEKDVRQRHPQVYQWVLERVKPERDQNARKAYRVNWWLFGEPRSNFRPALKDIPRYIATVKTGRHRWFTFLASNVMPDSKLIAIALDDANLLGVLSSNLHCTWTLAAGSRLGVGNDPTYVTGNSFNKFPFPAASSEQQQRIRELGEQLDAHRKARQAAQPGLTMTQMYNVLETLRSGATLTAKEKTIHEQGLVSVLKQLHDDLDAAVAEAYGWPVDLSEDEILERLVALNAERAQEEANGQIRWLRPAFQNQSASASTQTDLQMATATKQAVAPVKAKWDWPKALPDQMRLLRQALNEASGPVAPAAVARLFRRAPVKKVEELLETLASLGHIRLRSDGSYSA